MPMTRFRIVPSTSAFIDGMVMPLIGQVTGGVDFNNKKWILTQTVEEVKDAAGNVVTPGVSEVAMKWGSFLTVNRE